MYILYPTSYEISIDKLQKRVRVRVVIPHVRVPVHVLNLNLSYIDQKTKNGVNK